MSVMCFMVPHVQHLGNAVWGLQGTKGLLRSLGTFWKLLEDILEALDSTGTLLGSPLLNALHYPAALCQLLIELKHWTIGWIWQVDAMQ